MYNDEEKLLKQLEGRAWNLLFTKENYLNIWKSQ